MDSYKSVDDENHEFKISAAARRFLRMKTKLADTHKNKKVIIISARVHPGEAVSSHIMRGFIDYVLGDTKEARTIRKNYIVKIVPMLNPDGVIYGNYRASLLGVDLNRRWAHPSRVAHPTIYYTKKLIKIMSESHKVAYYVDLHGHSRKRNSFMYGWVT